MKRIIKRYALCLILMITIFLLLKICSCCLPGDKIKNHISESLPILKSEGSYYHPFGYTENFKFQLDGFTDNLILNIALHKNMNKKENKFEKTIINSFYSEKNTSQYESLEKSVNSSEKNNVEYSRYWYGIQTIIRPLLVFFNYSEIRYIFMIFLAILLCVSSLLTYKNIGLLNTISLTISLSCMYIFFIPMSIQFSSMIFLCLITIIITNLLCIYKKTDFYPIFMFLVGGGNNIFRFINISSHNFWNAYNNYINL